MHEPPSDQILSPSTNTEKYNEISIPFDPAIFSFPQQLFHLLQIAENTQQEGIIAWAEDGKSFTVHDPNHFEATLLVKYFQMKKYASFTRQLCAYGFSCVRKGRKPGLYYHPNFLRDNYDACSCTTRGSGKAYPKKSVTYTGEIPGAFPMSSFPDSSGWGLQSNNFGSASQMEEDPRKRNKISASTFQPISAGAFGARVVQELHSNLEKATQSSWGEQSRPTMSDSSGSLTPPRADTATFLTSRLIGTSAPQDDSQQYRASSNATTQGLSTEGESSLNRQEAQETDAACMEPRSIQDMMVAPDFFWKKQKREREP